MKRSRREANLPDDTHYDKKIRQNNRCAPREEYHKQNEKTGNEKRVGNVIVRSGPSTVCERKEKHDLSNFISSCGTSVKLEDKEIEQNSVKVESPEININFASGLASLSVGQVDVNTETVNNILRNFRKQLIEILQSQNKGDSINLITSEEDVIVGDGSKNTEETMKDEETAVQLDAYGTDNENTENDWDSLCVIRPRSSISEKSDHNYSEFDVTKSDEILPENNLKNKLSKLDIFGQNSDGDTLLHLALIHNENNLSSALIELMQKESLNIQNKLGQAPLHLAIHLENLEITKKLVSNGASVAIVDHDGNTALHLACMSKRENLIKTVIFGHSFIGDSVGLQKAFRTRNYNGEVPLHIALSIIMESGKDKILQLLLRRNNDINLRDGKTGKTCLQIALEHKDIKTTKYLIDRGADVNIADFSGRSPLHVASEFGNTELVNALVKKSASVHMKNVELQTPKDIAATEDVKEILDKEMKRVRRHRQKTKQLQTLEKKIINNLGKSF